VTSCLCIRITLLSGPSGIFLLGGNDGDEVGSNGGGDEGEFLTLVVTLFFAIQRYRFLNPRPSDMNCDCMR
jgi:hypothetical protein